MEDKPKKKQWKFGKEMPHFSGRSYSELNDIYPIQNRLKDDVWKLVGLMQPAWILTQRQMEPQVGVRIPWCRFQELCWFQRCEEAKEGFATHGYPVIKGMNISGALFAARKAYLTKLGLVENIPLTANRARLYRVTGLGKLLIKCFVENLTQASNNLEMWMASINDNDALKKITYYLVTQYPEWKGKGFVLESPRKEEESKLESSQPFQE